MHYKRYSLNTRVVKDLRKRSSFGIVFYIMAAFVVVYAGDYYLRNRGFSVLFVGSITGVCLLRYLYLLVHHRIENYSQRLNEIIFISSVIVTSSIWGAGFACFMVESGEYNAKLLMAICTIGMCSGGVVAFIPYRRLAVAFNILMLIPAAVMMIAEQVNFPLIVLILMYSGYLMLITVKGNKEYWDALENEVKLMEKTRELQSLSHTDVLTGIYNRRYFDDVFAVEWKRASRDNKILTLLICDIDRFKNVNDTFGHLAGDEYLKKIAGILRNVFKRETDVTARYGGEEFVVLLLGVDSRKAFSLAEKVRIAVSKSSLEYKEMEIRTTISFGIASCIPDHKENRKRLIAKADAALYTSKKEGRNRVTVV